MSAISLESDFFSFFYKFFMFIFVLDFFSFFLVILNTGGYFRIGEVRTW